MNPAAPQNAKLSQTNNDQQIVDNTYLPADQSLAGVEGTQDPTQTQDTPDTTQTTRQQKEQDVQDELEQPQQVQVEPLVYKSDLQDNGAQIVDADQ